MYSGVVVWVYVLGVFATIVWGIIFLRYKKRDIDHGHRVRHRAAIDHTEKKAVLTSGNYGNGTHDSATLITDGYTDTNMVPHDTMGDQSEIIVTTDFQYHMKFSPDTLNKQSDESKSDIFDQNDIFSCDTMLDHSENSKSNGNFNHIVISAHRTLSGLSENSNAGNISDQTDIFPRDTMLDQSDSSMSNGIFDASCTSSRNTSVDQSDSVPVTVAPSGEGGGPYIQPESGQCRVTDDLGQPLMFPESYTGQPRDHFYLNSPSRRMTDDLGQPLMHPESYTGQQRRPY